MLGKRRGHGSGSGGQDDDARLAAAYNFVAVPLAILGFASPLVAALAMSGSSLLVTANALRARRVPAESA